LSPPSLQHNQKKEGDGNSYHCLLRCNKTKKKKVVVVTLFVTTKLKKKVTIVIVVAFVIAT
jgi:hypothetical protein